MAKPKAQGASPQSLEEAARAALDALKYAESAMSYSAATLSPGNSRDRRGEWVEVHAGRAGSSYQQLRAAREKVQDAAAGLEALLTAAPAESSPPQAPAPGSVTPEGIAVRPGQIWEDMDKRQSGRKVQVIAVEGGKAVIAAWSPGLRRASGAHSRISIQRMRRGSTGWRLVTQADG